MTYAAQKRAISNYRSRQAQRGIARFEVQALDADRELITGPVAPNQGVPIPPPYAPFFPHDQGRSLKFRLIAVPLASPTFAKTIATGTISFGATMNPRLTLDAYPLYPNSPTANVLSCDVSQMKQQLAQLGLYDKIEASLGATTDPATISWNTGGTMNFGGLLSNKITATLGYGPTDMSLLINNALTANT